RGRSRRRGRPARRGAARAGRALGTGKGPCRRRGPAGVGPARDPQLRPHARARDRKRRAVRLAARPRGVGRPGVRGSRGPAGRAARCGNRATARRRAALARSADDVRPGRRVGPAAGRDERGQEGPRRPAALRGARRARSTVHSGLAGRVPVARRVRRGGLDMIVYVLNGPNLGRLGTRETDVYGLISYAELGERCVRDGNALGLDVTVRQTDVEHEMIGWLHAAADESAPVVLNPAAWSHYSYALRDACALLRAPLVEVHIS